MKAQRFCKIRKSAIQQSFAVIGNTTVRRNNSSSIRSQSRAQGRIVFRDRCIKITCVSGGDSFIPKFHATLKVNHVICRERDTCCCSENCKNRYAPPDLRRSSHRRSENPRTLCDSALRQKK